MEGHTKDMRYLTFALGKGGWRIRHWHFSKR